MLGVCNPVLSWTSPEVKCRISLKGCPTLRDGAKTIVPAIVTIYPSPSHNKSHRTWKSHASLPNKQFIFPSWYREIWSDQWGGVQRDQRRRMPHAMVNSLGWGWLRWWMPPEHLKIQAKRFEILKKGSLVGSLALFLLRGCLDDCAAATCVSQWVVFWMKRNSVQPRIRLGWQRVAGLLFLEWSTGDELWGRSSSIFQNYVPFVSYEPFPLEFCLEGGGRQQDLTCCLVILTHKTLMTNGTGLAQSAHKDKT